MPNGGELRVAGETSGDRLVVTFANTGPPISTNHLPRLFEPFFTTKPSGSGLGLFVSHMIVQQHGAELSVANLPDGNGVCFTMALPLAPPPYTGAGGAAEAGEP
jgi:two-component system NtrC family sensor kinase